MKLSYRKKLLNREQKKRLKILIPVFFVSLILFIIAFNIEKNALIFDNKSAASLPTLSVASKGETYGEFFGYKTNIEVGRIRNGLIPLADSREITYSINKYGNDVTDLSYEIVTGDGIRRITSGKVEDFEETKENLTASLALSNLIDEGREYIMAIKLTCNNQKLNYYTRIKYVSDGREEECIEFARNFMHTSLSSDYESLATYMEPKDNLEQTGLAKVTINSKLNDIGWKGLNVKDYTEPKIQFAEIDKNYTALELNYYVTGEDSRNSGTYKVNEYYRMRKGEERIYLLDFERNITQIFTDNISKIEDNKMVLGQNGREIKFVSNRTGTNIAFVWDGELYEYNQAESVLTKVFSFGNNDINDERTTHREYDIDIINIDENGNIYYAVYGYMNSGEHEGYCGVGLYNYNPIEGKSIEQAFLNTNHSFSSLKAGFDGDIFLSSAGTLYVCIEDELISYDLNNNKLDYMLSGKKNTSFALSQDRRYLAYSTEDSNKIDIIDLFTEEVSSLEISPENKGIVVNFMGDDLVYGNIDVNDYNENNINNNVFPMKELVIVDVVSKNHEIKKTYSKENKYITKVSKESDYNLSLKLSSKMGDVFVENEKDSIQNIVGSESSEAKLVKIFDDNVAYISIEFSELTAKSLKKSITEKGFVEPNISFYNTKKDLIAKVTDNIPYYFSYRGMNVISSNKSTSEVIHDAYKNSGYCIDGYGNYIWQYGRGTSKKTIDISGYTTSEKTRINLMGGNLEEMLSFVYRDNPVFVNEGGEDSLMIIGFDTNSITIYRQKSRETETVPLDEATESFDKQGNNFSVYTETSSYSE